MEGLSLSIHVYFLLDDPFEKLLKRCWVRSLAGLAAACCVLYSLHSCVSLSKMAPNFSKSAVILMYITLSLLYTANSRVWCSEDF